MNKRRTFKAFNKNSLKTYIRRRSNEEVLGYANNKRSERLANPTASELAFEQILRQNRISYEREHIILNGDRFVLLDFMLTERNVAIEIDGGYHAKQIRYDIERDQWLREQRGIRVIRIPNRTVLSEPEEMIRQIQLALKDQTESAI